MQPNKIRFETAHTYRPLSAPSALNSLIALAAVFAGILQGLASAATSAEPPAQKMIPVPHPITSLLRSATIHRELNLAPGAVEQIERGVSGIEQPLWRLRDLPPEKRNEQVEQLLGQIRKRLSEIMSARQIERLDQIVWQAQGVDALPEPEVIARLGLSAQQVGSITSLLNTGYRKIAELRLNPQIKPESARLAQIVQVQADAQQNIAAVLSSSQKNAYTLLIGRPMNLSQVRAVACKAPEIEADTWINSSPVKLSQLEGKVKVVHFYAFGCGNCVRSLAYYNVSYRQGRLRSLLVLRRAELAGQREREVPARQDRGTD